MLQKPDTKTKALLDLADLMEKLPADLYDQRDFFDAGRGAGCIAHWATVVTGCEHSVNAAGRALGLDQFQAMDLFKPDGGSVEMMGDGGSVEDDGLPTARGPTPKEAAKAIRYLAVTGMTPVAW